MHNEFLIGLNTLLVIITILLLLRRQDHFDSKEDIYLFLSLLNKIKMTQEEALTALSGIKAQLQKATAEITTKITSLQAALDAAGNITPEVSAALEELKATAQQLDDVVPDEVAPVE